MLRHSSSRLTRALQLWQRATEHDPPAALQAAQSLPSLRAFSSGGSATPSAGAAEGAQQAAHRPSSDSGGGVDAAEVDKFSAQAGEWWDPRGPAAPLHAMNAVRVPFICEAAAAAGLGESRTPLATPLGGVSVLDAGCGGGVLAEALARRGGAVTGLDASAACIAAAQAHAQVDPELAQRLEYGQGLLGSLVREGREFDLVVASEVLEHVPDPGAFCAELGELTRPGGVAVVSTLSRTLQSWAVAIAGAEWLTRALPPGTHDWAKFVTPEELVALMGRAGLGLARISGLFYDPLGGAWSPTESRAVNYIAAFRKAGAAAKKEEGVGPSGPEAAGASDQTGL